jgi:hypothetical protein
MSPQTQIHLRVPYFFTLFTFQSPLRFSRSSLCILPCRRSLVNSKFVANFWLVVRDSLVVYPTAKPSFATARSATAYIYYHADNLLSTPFLLPFPGPLSVILRSISNPQMRQLLYTNTRDGLFTNDYTTLIYPYI